MIHNQTKPRSVFTASYQYGNTEEEYVFACKGRPFAALISDNLPTPVSNLIDHNLVRDLGLKMTNLQCRKFHYAGHKMRILGKISTAVQCIQDGRTNGGFHLKGLVVTNLDQFLDTQVIVSAKMRGNIKKMSSNYVNERKRSTGDSADSYSDSSLGSDTDDSDSVVSTQALEDLLLAPDSTSVTSVMMTSPAVDSATMSSTSSPPTVSSSTFSPPMVSSSVSTVTSSITMSSTPSTTAVCSPNSTVTSLLVPTTTSYSGSASSTQASYRSRLPILAHRCPVSANYWGPSAEMRGRIIYQSNKDGKPRITNIKGGRKLRVGIWSDLDDPVAHERRHVVLANLRQAAPERLCTSCFYHPLQQHTCVLTTEYGEHCQDCCDQDAEDQLKDSVKRYKNALELM